MFQNWFVSRRELKRLAKSEEYWRSRALDYEKRLEAQRVEMQAKLDIANRKTQEAVFSCWDRFLTTEKKTYAVADEIKRNALRDDSPQAIKNEYEDGLRAHLEMRREELEEKAEEARAEGIQVNPESEFMRYRNQYVAEFESTYFTAEPN